MSPPDALDRTDAHAGRPRHCCARPVSGLARPPFHRQGDDALGDRGSEFGDARASRFVAQKTIEPFSREALLPVPDTSFGLAGVAHDHVRAQTIGTQQNDPRSPNVLLSRVAVPHESPKPVQIVRSDRKRNAASHVADSHTASQSGILIGIQMSDLIH
jgi:hypothetical protein